MFLIFNLLVCLSGCPSVWLRVSMSVSLCIFLSGLSACLLACLYICRHVCLSVCLPPSVCLHVSLFCKTSIFLSASVCLSAYLCLFVVLPLLVFLSFCLLASLPGCLLHSEQHDVLTSRYEISTNVNDEKIFHDRAVNQSCGDGFWYESCLYHKHSQKPTNRATLKRWPQEHKTPHNTYRGNLPYTRGVWQNFSV